MLGLLFASAVEKNAADLKKANNLYEQKKFADAIKIYRRILKRNPKHFAARANLATAYFETENFKAAAPLFAELIRCDTANPWWHNYLSQSCQQTGRLQQALAEAWQAVVLSGGQKEHQLNLAYTIYETADMIGYDTVDSVLQKWHRKYPHNAIVRQCYKSFHQDNKFICSEPEYVESLFDVFAPDFDKVLAELGYCVPQEISRMLAEYFAGKVMAKKWILDLGCGSGLCASAVAENFPQSHFVGMDISAGMLKEAERKNIYTSLIQGNISACGKQIKRRFSVVTAADVFTYFGRLDSLFAEVGKLLFRNGVFAFSISENTTNGKDFFLMPSSRFVHRPEYVENVLRKQGFEVVKNERKILRTEGEKEVAGRIILAVKK